MFLRETTRNPVILEGLSAQDKPTAPRCVCLLAGQLAQETLLLWKEYRWQCAEIFVLEKLIHFMGH